MIPPRVAGALLLVLAVAGCATSRTARKAPDGACLPPGRGLVVARVLSEENRATVDTAADLLVNALREAAPVIGVRELVGEAGSTGLGPWATATSGRLERGARLTREDGRVLAEQFDVRTLVVLELTEYEQVWGKYGKFTRAGVDAQAFDLALDRTLWRLHGDTEVEEMRGRAFRFAMEQAVHGLAQAICPRPRSFSLTDTWRSWRR
jgi:hypothetical protein